MMVNRHLKSTTDSIVNWVQIQTIRWPHVWLNELHVLANSKLVTVDVG